MKTPVDFKRSNIEYKEDPDPCHSSKAAIDIFGADVAKIFFKIPRGGDIDGPILTLGGRINFTTRAALGGVFNGAIVVHGPNDFDILLPDSTSPQTDRFTIAHELGHYLLHSKQGVIPILADRHWGQSTQRVEWEANWFAAGFLMPEEDVKEFLKTNSRDPEAIAAAFNVSFSAAKIRLSLFEELSIAT